MASINLQNVSVDIPVYNSQGRSLKKNLLSMATGGKIGLSDKGVTIVHALSNINLKVSPYERVGLLGHNGAGKSTLLRVLGGVYEPTTGSISTIGKIGSLIGISLGIDTEATGLENIFLRGALLGIDRKKIVSQLENIIEFSELGSYINLPVRTYSTGMHMRLAFTVSTMVKSDILLMDEWLSVGDASFQNKAEKRLTDLVKSANILVIASHSRQLIEKTCTRAVWLEHGQIIDDGDPTEICKKYFSK